ncbi:chromate transporter [Aromatoleum diolicum]|uniref:Chromate transporter n=1 Tax=Aromatoleum diolicum TaxID=75796 RepID=A0ABX1Q9Q2_9RHOO|nr:chromate transporter [Aromatoleum diolicum]NMG74698.1 chromate transporter [Aromatoleum diolicum]
MSRPPVVADSRTAPHIAPPSLGELFRACSRVGLSGFGGVLPLLRHLLVDERRLMSGADFNALLGLCQFLPGSNVVNLAVCVGARFHGARGAIVATAGLLLGPFLVMMALATAYGLWGQLAIVQDMLRGIAAAGAGLLFATALKMARNVPERWIYLPFSALILVALVVLRLPLPPLMLALLGITGLIAYRRARNAAAIATSAGEERA